MPGHSLPSTTRSRPRGGMQCLLYCCDQGSTRDRDKSSGYKGSQAEAARAGCRTVTKAPSFSLPTVRVTAIPPTAATWPSLAIDLRRPLTRRAPPQKAGICEDGPNLTGWSALADVATAPAVIHRRRCTSIITMALGQAEAGWRKRLPGRRAGAGTHDLMRPDVNATQRWQTGPRSPLRPVGRGVRRALQAVVTRLA